MTDQTIPAGISPDEVEAAREWATSYLAGFYKPGHADAAARALTALLPTPSRPTLADMTPRERRACQWLQADVKGVETRAVIVNPHEEDGTARVVWPGEFNEPADWEEVTPRPDLPRLEWQGDEKPAPAPALPDGWRLADHKVYGRVIVTMEKPDDDGELGFIHRGDGLRRQHAHDWCQPDDLTFLDQEGDTPTGPGHLAVGSVWDDADALAQACYGSGRDQITVTDKDGDVSVWGADAGWWETGSPDFGFEPYTIIHAGKKADQ